MDTEVVFPAVDVVGDAGCEPLAVWSCLNACVVPAW